MILRRFRWTTAAVGVAASALLGGSMVTAGPAVADDIIYDQVTTAAGTNWCEYQIHGQDLQHSFPKELRIQTHGATYTCFVQVVDFAEVTHSYTDYPGNGWSYFGFTYSVRRIRACQNGNPGRCSAWRD